MVCNRTGISLKNKIFFMDGKRSENRTPVLEVERLTGLKGLATVRERRILPIEK
jgi:hypothetical protein